MLQSTSSRRQRFRQRMVAAGIFALFVLLPVTASAQRGKFVKPILKKHNAATWHRYTAFQADITVKFGGGTPIDGSIVFRTDTSGVRIEQKNGSVAVWDGEEAWVTPNRDAFPGARFHLLTWPYFLAAPMKLNDPGTKIEVLEGALLFGEPHDTARLTFKDDVGDTPDDWYILYRDPKTRQLAAMAYIVTFGATQEKAEEAPHLIHYSAFEEVGDVLIATRWSFYNWNEKQGAHGDPIGSVEIRNPRMVAPPAEVFTQPPGAVADPLPGS